MRKEQSPGRPLAHSRNVKEFNIGRKNTYRYRGSRTVYFCWECTGENQILLHDASWEVKDTATTFDEKETIHINPDTLQKDGDTHEINLNVIYVSENTSDGVILPLNVTIFEPKCDSDYSSATVTEMKLHAATLPSKILNNTFFLQEDDELETTVKAKKPWLIEWIEKNPRYDIKRVLAAPWLETLEKAGFQAVTTRFLNPSLYLYPKDIDLFNKLCCAGNKPKDIFKCSKNVYTVLKEEKDLNVWDTMRRMEKKEQITGDTILMVYQMGLRPKELEYVNSIVNQRQNGQPVFSINALVNYLNRLDMYEAISNREALPLLNDYLHMCRQLGMPPRIDGDSLKREHDIAARLCREQRNREMEEKMRQKAEQEQREIQEGNSKLSRATYYENIFFIRPITEYNDLLDEAIQQSNCVASYADRIASGKSRIFTLRETAHPEKSLVTIELSPDCRTIRQKYLAHNQPIRNKAISDFIDRWHKQLNAA